MGKGVEEAGEEDDCVDEDLDGEEDVVRVLEEEVEDVGRRVGVRGLGEHRDGRDAPVESADEDEEEGDVATRLHGNRHFVRWCGFWIGRGEKNVWAAERPTHTPALMCIFWHSPTCFASAWSFGGPRRCTYLKKLLAPYGLNICVVLLLLLY